MALDLFQTNSMFDYNIEAIATIQDSNIWRVATWSD
jgi:hypothetical protein